LGDLGGVQKWGNPAVHTAIQQRLLTQPNLLNFLITIGATMVSISYNDDFVTQINQIKVKPEDQEQLVKLMSEQAEQVMSKQPGFISINIHRSLDGTRVVNYVQWSTKELLDAAHATPEFIDYFQKYKELIVEGGPYLYEIIYQKTSS
jgi:quinol monooxygenase YgiN